MRLSQCLAAAYLCSGASAFIPYSFHLKFSSILPVRDTLVSRFLPWKLLSGESDEDDSTSDPQTFDLIPVRRDNQYKVVMSNTPAGSNRTIALNQDGNDYSYFSVVKVGSQDQTMWMMLDTGGASTWLFASDCTSKACQLHSTFGEKVSSSLEMTNETWNVGYGTGTVNGLLGSDTITIAGMEIHMKMGLANNASDDFQSYPMDGIIGLGRSNDTSFGNPTFMDMVASDGGLSSNIVGFSLPRSLDNDTDGTVTFGGVDDTKFTGNISYTTARSDSDHWSIPLDDVSVDGTACGFTGKSAIIDTGTSYVLLPPKDATTLHNLIPGAAPSGEENFLIPCNSTAVVNVTFSGVSYTISPKDYIGAKFEKGCISTIIGKQMFSENDWLLGAVFLKNVYSVFDFDNERVGFATRKREERPTSSDDTATTKSESEGATTTATAESDNFGDSQGSTSGSDVLTVSRLWKVLAVVLCMWLP